MAYKSFQPWKGKHYKKTGLFMLGESAYSWKDENGQWQRPTLNLNRFFKVLTVYRTTFRSFRLLVFEPVSFGFHK